jgi:hypothetical protein
MRALPLSTAPNPAPISPHHAQNNLPIGAPPVASVERHRVVVSVAPLLSGTISKNPDDLLSLSLSLSLSYHDNLSSLGAAGPPRGRESTMDREPAVVS